MSSGDGPDRPEGYSMVFCDAIDGSLMEAGNATVKMVPFSVFAFHFDVAAHHLAESPADRKAEPGSAIFSLLWRHPPA